MKKFALWEDHKIAFLFASKKEAREMKEYLESKIDYLGVMLWISQVDEELARRSMRR